MSVIMSKFLYPGEEYDFEEIERRLISNGRLAIRPGEWVRVSDPSKGNMGQFADKLCTLRAEGGGVEEYMSFYGGRKQSPRGVGFAYDPRHYFGECIPLACIKTKARIALERAK